MNSKAKQRPGKGPAGGGRTDGRCTEHGLSDPGRQLSTVVIKALAKLAQNVCCLFARSRIQRNTTVEIEKESQNRSHKSDATAGQAPTETAPLLVPNRKLTSLAELICQFSLLTSPLTLADPPTGGSPISRQSTPPTPTSPLLPLLLTHPASSHFV